MSRRGFTLIEVMVAVTIAAVLTLMAHSVFRAVADTWRRFDESRRHYDRMMNANRFLTEAFLSAEVRRDIGDFEGSTDHLAFDCWLQSPDGWFERVRLSLAVRQKRLVASGLPWGALSLTRDIDSVRFAYRLGLGGPGQWVPNWDSPVSAPMAIRLVRFMATTTDSTVYLVKERG